MWNVSRLHGTRPELAGADCGGETKIRGVERSEPLLFLERQNSEPQTSEGGAPHAPRATQPRTDSERCEGSTHGARSNCLYSSPTLGDETTQAEGKSERKDTTHSERPKGAVL